MAESLLNLFDLPAETRAIIATKPAAMPLEKFLSFLIQFGAFWYRDSYQQDALDLVVQQMNVQLTECRTDPGAALQGDPPPCNVVPLIPKPKDY